MNKLTVTAFLIPKNPTVLPEHFQRVPDFHKVRSTPGGASVVQTTLTDWWQTANVPLAGSPARSSGLVRPQERRYATLQKRSAVQRGRKSLAIVCVATSHDQFS